MDTNIISALEDDNIEETNIDVIEYSSLSYSKFNLKDFSYTFQPGYKYWFQVRGLKNELLITELCSRFNIHPLALEDILHTVQRPKIDDFSDALFLVLKMFYVDNGINSQQVSIFTKDNLLVSFEEHSCDSFKTIKKKLTDDRNHIRNKGEDYLLYSILDTIIDRYFDLEEYVFGEIEKLEAPINNNPQKKHLAALIDWRKEILQIKKAISPVNDMLQTIGRYDIPYFEKENKIFLRDLNDHLLRALDNLDTHRESVHSLMELYQSQINNKMNEVMKTLTIMSSIFIPLSFIAGVYGMNFDQMPELHQKYGYFASLGLMGLVAISLLIYFKHKKYF